MTLHSDDKLVLIAPHVQLKVQILKPRCRLGRRIVNVTPSSPGYTRQVAQLSQRDRAAGYIIVFAKSRRLELGDNILRT